MYEVDVNRVLNGTFHKRLLNAYNSLKDNMNDETIEDFYTVYRDGKLSDILNHADIIFREPIKGLDFIENIFNNPYVFIPPYKRKDVCDKLISSFKEICTNTRLPEEQKKRYDEALQNISKSCDDRKNTIILSRIETNDNLVTQIMVLYDILNEESKKNSNKNYDFINKFFKDIIDNGKVRDSLPYAFDILPMVNMGLLSILVEYALSDENICYDNIAWIKLLSYDNINEKLSKCGNHWLETRLNYIKNNSVKSILSKLSSLDSNDDFINSFDDAKSAVSSLFNDDETVDTCRDLLNQKKSVSLIKTKSLLESIHESVYREYLNKSLYEDCTNPLVHELIGHDDVTIEYAFDYLEDKIGNLGEELFILNESIMDDIDNSIMYEFTHDGTPSDVIRNHYKIFREEKKADKNPPSEDDLKKLEEENDGYDDEDMGDDDDTSNVKKTNDINDDTNNKLVSRNPKDTPEKPKESITRKIQNKAVDADVKMQKGMSNAQQGMKELKNAAKAVARIPGNLIDGAKSKFEEWNKLDEDKRKAKMLEPGYRSDIHKRIMKLIKYGAAWKLLGPLLSIKAWFISKIYRATIGKSLEKRDIRLRNELVAELDAEIEITNEKIQDAGANSDQKQKYQLMRIKKKLEAERVRVLTNSKLM
jgi:hypothetical protein